MPMPRICVVSFFLAYPQAQQGTREAEDMGRSVLSYQFVAGLRQEIKVKLAGVEGTFEELLVRARLEEAKLRDLSERMPTTHTPRKPLSPSSVHPATTTSAKTGNEGCNERPRGGPKCYNCGGRGHIARNCPLQGRAVPAEARGRTGSSVSSQRTTLNSLVADEDPKQAQRARVIELQCTLREAELEEANSCIDATLHGMELEGEQREAVSLGPMLTTVLTVEGTPVEAMIDTGSPVTVISLEFLLKMLAKQRPIEQSVEGWRVKVREQLKEPKISLRSYGGAKLNVICQTTITLVRAEFSTPATVYLQKNAPLKMLLGTDVLGALGIQVAMTTKGEVQDLLPKSESAPDPNSGELATSTEITPSPCGKKCQTVMVPPKSSMLPPAQTRSIWQSHLRPRTKPKGQVERGRPA